MKVYIHDIERESSYIATCLRDCRTLHDVALFENVIRMKEVVTLGKLIGEPI